MNTKKVCEALNVTNKALRIYEQYNIVVPKRDSNNYRNYSSNDLVKLRTVIVLKELGFSLKDICDLINKSDFADTQLVRSLYLQLKAAETKINELNYIKETLVAGIDKILANKSEFNNEYFFKSIDRSLKANRERRGEWVDMWGFDNKAIKYDRMVRQREDDELGLFEGYDEILEDIRNRIYEHEAKTVVDIGCGTGNLCGELAGDIDIIGIDQSLEMILQAKRKYSNMRFKIGNFLDRPLSEGDTDIVVTTYAFHSLNNLEKQTAVKNMLRYIRDNGKVIITDFMFENDKMRQECKKYFTSKNKFDLWQAIDSKYYTDIGKFKEYVESLNCSVSIKHMVNFTWTFEITRKKKC